MERSETHHRHDAHFKLVLYRGARNNDGFRCAPRILSATGPGAFWRASPPRPPSASTPPRRGIHPVGCAATHSRKGMKRRGVSIPLRGGVDAEGGRGGYGVSLETPGNNEHHMRIKPASIVLLTALIAVQGVFAQPPDCASGAFLKRYLKSGLAAFSPDGAMELRSRPGNINIDDEWVAINARL